MNFERITTWAEVSDCGRYSVSASMHAETLDAKVKRYLFTAWLRNAGGTPHVLLVDADAELCRQACRNHAAAQAAK